MSPLASQLVRAGAALLVAFLVLVPEPARARQPAFEIACDSVEVGRPIVLSLHGTASPPFPSIDLRGLCGMADVIELNYRTVPRRSEDWDALSLHVQLLVDTLRHGDQPVVVVGYSQGAPYALRLVLAAMSRTSVDRVSLLLVAPAGRILAPARWFAPREVRRMTDAWAIAEDELLSGAATGDPVAAALLGRTSLVVGGKDHVVHPAGFRALRDALPREHVHLHPDATHTSFLRHSEVSVYVRQLIAASGEDRRVPPRDPSGG